MRAKGLVSVLGCYTGTLGYTDRPERPEYGLRSRPKLLGRYFRDPERVYAVVPRLSLQISLICGYVSALIRVLFKFGCIIFMLIAASCVNVLGLKVKSLGKPLHVNSPLGTRVSVDKIYRDCELKISGILLMVDLRVKDISNFDVILGMDWLTVHRVVIDCDSRRITAYTPDGIRVTFQGAKHDALPQTVHDSRWSGQLMGWLASLTLEDDERRDLSLPRAV